MPIERAEYVYFAKDVQCDLIKIGHTNGHPLLRLCGAALTFNPHEVVLVGAFKGTCRDEKRLHQQFAADRVRGEWFRSSVALAKLIGEKTVSAQELLSSYAYTRRDHWLRVQALVAAMPGGDSVVPGDCTSPHHVN